MWQRNKSTDDNNHVKTMRVNKLKAVEESSEKKQEVDKI